MEKPNLQRPLANIRAMLFDFDGTLAPNLDLPDMRRQVIELTQQAAVPEAIYTDRYIVEVIDAATNWLNSRDQATAARYYEDAHQLIIDIEMQAAANTEPFPGIPQFLKNLRSAGIGTAVVTRNCRAAILKTFPDLKGCVDAIFARDDVSTLKPDPGHLTQALAHLGQPASNAAMIGDGRLDMHAGKSLGMYCIGVLGGSSDQQSLLSAGADLVVDKCTALETMDF